jgi:(E)-4-hydroxy-3-methylbut-2-enyl-diphosphate synthase
MTRKLTLKSQTGKIVEIGGGAPVSVQTMCNTKTSDAAATLEQIREMAIAGADVIRVTLPSHDDVESFAAICKASQVPIVADIHFDATLVEAAINAGAAGVRVNPGNIIRFEERLPAMCEFASAKNVPMRIGVNAGSLGKRLMEKYATQIEEIGGVPADALVESALYEAKLFEDCGFFDFAISVKHHDPDVVVEAYEKLSKSCDYPLHLGVTEAGPLIQGTVKSAVAFTKLLSRGIGDTIRVSLSDDPVKEIEVGIEILQSLGLRERTLEIISCPTCGRTEVDLIGLTNTVKNAFSTDSTLSGIPIKVAVMGCIVNGPGEARFADIGVAGGQGVGKLFIKGEVVRTVPEDEIADALLELAHQYVQNL